MDKIRWIDTSTMLADPLTKVMNSDRLVTALDKGHIDLNPTAASTVAKLMKQKQRRRVKDENDHLLDDIGMTYDHDHAESYLVEGDLYGKGVSTCTDDKSHECETTLTVRPSSGTRQGTPI